MILCPCSFSPDLTALHCMALHARAWSPRQSTMSGKEDGDNPRGCNPGEVLPSIPPGNTPCSHGFWMLLAPPSTSTSCAPTRTSRGSSRDALGCQSSAPGGKGIRAGGDGRQAGAQPQGLKKAVPKMSGKGCLSLRGDSRQRRLPLHPASHIPRPAPCLSSRRLSRLANPGCPRLALLIEPNQ